MTTYNTGNPIGSKDPRDLYDNSENLDVAVNDDAATWVDRLGVQRSTLWQMLEYSKQFNDRGDWHTSTAYARKDYFTYGGVTYVTLTAHTSTSVAADLAAGKIGVMSGNSGAMDFLQSGTGAVSRSVESKLRDVISVLDFIPSAEHAAIKAGTSTYNCTTAFNAALKGKSVYIPSGTYNLNALDPIGSPKHIYGDHFSTILLFNTTSDCIKLKAVSTAEGITIKNIVFKTQTNRPTAIIHSYDEHNVRITDCHFVRCTADYAILNTNCWGLTLTNTSISAFTGLAAICLKSGPTAFSYVINLHSCSITNVWGKLIEMEGGDLNVFGGAYQGQYPGTGDGVLIDLSTKQYGMANFYGVYFEQSNACIIRSPSSSTWWTTNLGFYGCKFVTTNCNIETGRRGTVTFIGCNKGGGTKLVIKATGDENHGRFEFINTDTINFGFDKTIRNYNTNPVYQAFAFSGSGAKSTGIRTVYGTGATVTCHDYVDANHGSITKFLIMFGNYDQIFVEQLGAVTLSQGAGGSWTFGIDSDKFLTVTYSLSGSYRINIEYMKQVY